MSLDIPSGIILLWPGSNGSIPSGFSRENDLNDKFPVGAASGAGAGSTGGGNSHTHGTTHQHGGNFTHTHTGTTPENIVRPPISQRRLAVGPAPYGTSAHQSHTHEWTSSAATRNWGAGGGFGSGGADPSYYNMVFIKSDGSPETYPTNCVVMRNDADGVSGWTQHSGSKSRYIQGAGSGGNGGGTGGGGHTHNLGSHGHSYGGHTHGTSTNTSSTSATSPQLGIGDSGWARSTPNHYHPLKSNLSPYLGSTNSGTASALTSNSTTRSPVYRYMWGLEKTSASAKEDEGMIVLWNDSIANIPDDWLLCDGTNDTPDLRDKFLRMANSSGEVGGTGGANTHSHGGGSHSHSGGSAHTHRVNGTNQYVWPQQSYGDTYGAQPGGNTSANVGCKAPSYHSYSTPANPIPDHLWDSGNNTGGLTPPSTTASLNSVEDRPPYRTIVYLFSPEGEEAGGNVGMFGSTF